MEWTWLRDWWRLKRLRHSQLRHSHEDIYYGNSDDEDDDDDDICYCDECVNVGDLFSIESRLLCQMPECTNLEHSTIYYILPLLAQLSHFSRNRFGVCQ